ncbi:hypothetical protein HY464_02525 [Candidatus Peregrinibacteria bacterium]|nr:hypothetical protein [Candidatus Peregrinibacteria bacterium]
MYVFWIGVNLENPQALETYYRSIDRWLRENDREVLSANEEQRYGGKRPRVILATRKKQK